MNCCVFAGRILRDCEVRQTNNGKSVGNYAIAVDDGFGENKRTLFLNCTHWNCEKVAQYLTKGKAVIVRGKLQQREYEKDGQKVRVYELNVQESHFQQGSHGQATKQQPQALAPDKSDNPEWF